MDMSLSKLREMVEDRKPWCAAVPGVTKSYTWLSNWTATANIQGNLEDQMWTQGWIRTQKTHQAFTSGQRLSSVQAIREGWNWAVSCQTKCRRSVHICKANVQSWDQYFTFGLRYFCQKLKDHLANETETSVPIPDEGYSLYDISSENPPNKQTTTHAKQHQEREKLIARVTI